MIAAMTAVAADPMTKLEVTQCHITATQIYKYNLGSNYDMTATWTLTVTSILGNFQKKLLSLA